MEFVKTSKGTHRSILSVAFASMVAASLFIFSGISAPAAMALPVMDEKDDSTDPNFDIRAYGFDGAGRPWIQVYGNAGATLPDPSDPKQGLAYVLVTDRGVWAINSHAERHSTDVADVTYMWHAEKVFVTGDCITGIDIGSETNAMLDGTNARADSKDKDDVAKVLVAKTVKFELQVDNPDDPPAGTICVALITGTYDFAGLGEASVPEEPPVTG